MKDPTRLADPRSQASAPLRRLLAAAKSDPTSPARIRKLGARLGPFIGSGGTGGAAAGGTGGVGAGPSVASAAGGAVKLGVAIALTAAVATGALVARMGATTAGDAANGAPSTAFASTALAPTAPPPTPAIPSARAPVPVVAAHPSATVMSVATAKPATPPTAMVASKPTAPARESAPELRSPDKGVAVPLVAGPRPEPTSAPEPAPIEETRDETKNETEVALLRAAQSALRDDPSGALAITDRHAARFGAGSLAQEREVIAIEALVKLGRLDEAEERATKFSRDFPNSAHRLRVDAIVRGATHKP